MSIPFRILCVAGKCVTASIAQTLSDSFSGSNAALCHSVTTVAELQAALSQPWDLVIATALPDAIDPLTALRQVRALSNAPLIVVGDRLSATDAIALIKAGADDYLELDQLVQLPLRLAPVRQQSVEQEEQRQRSAKMQAVSLSVAQADTATEAAALLPPLCQAFGWDVGEFWVATAQTLQPIAQWCSPTVANFALECAPAIAVMPSAIAADRLLEPIADRLQAATTAKLQSVWSFPICSGAERLGVLIFYSRQVQHPQPDLLELMPMLTAQLGQLLKRQQSELALQQLEAIVSLTEDAIISTDIKGRVLSWNAGAERLYGYRATEAIGQRLTQLIQPQSERLWREELPPQAIDRYQVKHQRKTGELIDVLMTLSLIQDRRDRVSGIAIIARISGRQALDCLKDEFISTISHELRTPIAALQGSIDLLLSGKLGDLSDRGLHLLHLAARNSDRLVQLTNNIFDLELFASDRVQLYPQPCQVSDLVEQAAIAMQSVVCKAQINLRVHLQPTQIFADPQRISQVLTNLLSNAIKFSAAGDTIWLTVESRSSLASPTAMQAVSPTGSYVVIQVKDQGVGIPAHQLDAIFQRFGQADASDARPQTGVGLGLALCRSIVRRHQGYLWVESAIGQGSTFYLALPIASAAFPLPPGNSEGRGVKNLLEVARGS